QNTLPFIHFAEDTFFLPEEDDQLRYMTEAEKEYFVKLQDSVLNELVSEGVFESSENLVLTHGKYRWHPKVLEYDLVFTDISQSNTQHRTVILKPIENFHVVKSGTARRMTVINIVLILDEPSVILQRFLDHLAMDILSKDPFVTLSVLLTDSNQIERTRQMLYRSFKYQPKFEWKIILTTIEEVLDGNFWYAHKNLNLGDLVFLIDEEVVLNPDFLQRCRTVAAEGMQAYFPMVFEWYNPAVVYPLYGQAPPSLYSQMHGAKPELNYGHWLKDRYDSVCMFRSDLQGLQQEPDDLYVDDKDNSDGAFKELYSKAIKKLKVIHGPDPDLHFLWRAPDNCSVNEHSVYNSCVQAHARSMGNRLQLGLVNLHFAEGTKIEGILRKRSSSKRRKRHKNRRESNSTMSHPTILLLPLMILGLIISVAGNIGQGFLMYKQCTDYKELPS
ncbi:unnamed protein product, partial [Meganyctiphanes norvegica]